MKEQILKNVKEDNYKEKEGWGKSYRRNLRKNGNNQLANHANLGIFSTSLLYIRPQSIFVTTIYLFQCIFIETKGIFSHVYTAWQVDLIPK